jgi:histidyl-tRNA synthetase
MIDKSGKASAAELGGQWDAAFGARLSYGRLRELLSADSLEALGAKIGSAAASAGYGAAAEETARLSAILHEFGITEYCKFDLAIVRGLAYYTGPVFEFYDRSQNERAICGGGRYDDLLGKLGKSREPAVGFGMGDVVLSLILAEKGLTRGRPGGGGVLVADAADGLRPTLHRVVAALRRGGIQAEFNYARQALGKQLRAADKRGLRFVVVLGAETLERKVVQVKDMAGGEGREVPLDALLAGPTDFLEPSGDHTAKPL